MTLILSSAKEIINMANLDRERIVDMALQLLDTRGFDGLTMRALAKRLHIENPALYWHFKNKQEIVDAMAARILERAVVRRRHDESWQRWLSRTARALRNALRSYRDATRIVAEADLSDTPWIEAQQQACAELEREGFPPKSALVAIVTLSDFTLGATWEQEADPAQPRRGGKAMFEAGIAIIIAGIEHTLP